MCDYMLAVSHLVKLLDKLHIIEKLSFLIIDTESSLCFQEACLWLKLIPVAQ
jgi:hypothetical protein